MTTLSILDPKGAILTEDQSACTTSPHGVMATIGPDQPQFPPRRVGSPKSDHFPPNVRRADSQQSQVHSHGEEPHAASTEDQLTDWHHRSMLNSASHVKLWLQPNRASKSSPSSEVKNTQRFTPYLNATKHIQTLPKASALDRPSDKSSRSRKRTIILKPKCPKYEGLSHFAAPVDLVSDMIPCTNAHNSGKSSSPSLKSVSSLTTDKMSWESNTDSTNTDTHPTEENNQIPVDFLKYLDFDEWDRRRQDLSQMVEERKNLFLQKGFAQTSGKPFQPDEQAIEKKPIPNRWVWYMHLSTDYDKLKSTRVPPGGPAGYLKYGWDRLGPAGKQPYQELADIYAAQRLKFMAALGIPQESTRKKSKHTEKVKSKPHSTQKSLLRDDKKSAEFTNEPFDSSGKMNFRSIDKSTTAEVSNQRPNFHVDMPFVPVQPFLQYNLLYQQLNPFVHEKLNWNYSNGPGDFFEMSEASPYPSNFRSPDISSDYFSPSYNEPGYSPHLISDPIQSQGAPFRSPSSPNENLLSCSSSIFPGQVPSEFQLRYTVSPSSINSSHSEISGLLSTPCVDGGSVLNSAFSSLQRSDLFCELLNRQEIDLHDLNPVNINY